MATRMNDAEAVMWAAESDPFLRSDFVNLTVLGRPPDAERLGRAIARALAAYPPLRQRAVRPPLGLAPPEWTDDLDFDLDYHVRRVAVPPPGGHRQLLDLAAALAAVPIDRARPLWALYLVEGLAGGRAAVLQHLHHSLTDGVGAVRLLRNLLERTPDGEAATPAPGSGPAPDPRVWRHPEIFSPADAGPMADWMEAGRHDGPARPDRLAVPFGAVAGALGYRLGQGLEVARKGLDVAAAVRRTDEVRLLAERAGRLARSVADQVLVTGGPLSPLMEGRSLARRFETASLDVDDVRRAARAHRASRNAVFVAGVTGALLAYHERMGAPCETLRMALPLTLRGEPGRAGGNHFAPVRLVIALTPKDPAERVARTRDALAAVAAEPGLGLAEPLAGVASLLPPAVLVPALRAQARTVDFATSVVPGLRSARWLAGARVEGCWPMGPRVGCAVNLTLLACGDRLDLGVNLDPAAITDPAGFMECLGDSFDAVLDTPGR